MAAHRSPRLTLALALSALALGGCDKLGGGDAPPQDEATRAAEAAAQQAAQEAAEAKARTDEAKKQIEDAQRLSAEAEAKRREVEQEAERLATEKKAAEAEAARKAEQDASRPVLLSNIGVSGSGALFGSSGMLELTAKAKLNQALDSSTYVHVKSLCKKDDRLVADVGYLNAHYSKPLEKYAKGEEADIKGTLYTQGLDSSLSPCQFEFRVGGISGGLSQQVGQACWSGKEVVEGKCEPALIPVAMSGAGSPVEVADLQVSPSGGFGGSKGLDLKYLLQVNVPQDNSVRLTFKSACRVADKSFVDMSQANLMAGPFKYESGETVARSANLYWSSSFELADAPNDCDLTTSLWKTKAGTFGEYEELRLQDSCFKDGSLRTGRCDPSAPASAPPSPLAAESVEVGDVRLELMEPHGVSGKFQLKIQADVTVLKPVSQKDATTAKVSCKAGKENRVESAYLFGPELYYLESGQTARMSANAFGSHPLDTKPKSCKVEFFGGPRFSPSGSDGVDLGKFCLKKDKVKAGGKC